MPELELNTLFTPDPGNDDAPVKTCDDPAAIVVIDVPDLEIAQLPADEVEALPMLLPELRKACWVALDFMTWECPFEKTVPM